MIQFDKTAIKIIVSTLRTRPALTICATVKCPLAKTIALGGVDIGSIKAQLAAKVTGMVINKGSIPIPIRH